MEISKESDRFYGDFMAKFVLRLSGNLPCFSSIKTPDKLHNFYISCRQHNFSSEERTISHQIFLIVCSQT